MILCQQTRIIMHSAGDLDNTSVVKRWKVM